MRSRHHRSFLSVILLLQGLIFIFMARELSGSIALPEHPLLEVCMQLLGAVQGGWGILDWMSRN